MWPNAVAAAPALLSALALAPAINDLSSELCNCTAGCHGPSHCLCSRFPSMPHIAVDAIHAIDATNHHRSYTIHPDTRYADTRNAVLTRYAVVTCQCSTHTNPSFQA